MTRLCIWFFGLCLPLQLCDDFHFTAHLHPRRPRVHCALPSAIAVFWHIPYSHSESALRCVFSRYIAQYIWFFRRVSSRSRPAIFSLSSRCAFFIVALISPCLLLPSLSPLPSLSFVLSLSLFLSLSSIVAPLAQTCSGWCIDFSFIQPGLRIWLTDSCWGGRGQEFSQIRSGKLQIPPPPSIASSSMMFHWTLAPIFPYAICFDFFPIFCASSTPRFLLIIFLVNSKEFSIINRRILEFSVPTLLMFTDLVTSSRSLPVFSHFTRSQALIIHSSISSYRDFARYFGNSEFFVRLNQGWRILYANDGWIVMRKHHPKKARITAFRKFRENASCEIMIPRLRNYAFRHSSVNGVLYELYDFLRNCSNTLLDNIHQQCDRMHFYS